MIDTWVASSLLWLFSPLPYLLRTNDGKRASKQEKKEKRKKGIDIVDDAASYRSLTPLTHNNTIL
jgi:hypothetical protein